MRVRNFARCWRGAIPLAGWSHPLYPEGDPRAANLLAALKPQAAIASLRPAMEKETREKPNCDAAESAAMTRELGLPDRGAVLHLRAGAADGLGGARNGTAREWPDHPSACAVYGGVAG